MTRSCARHRRLGSARLGVATAPRWERHARCGSFAGRRPSARSAARSVQVHEFDPAAAACPPTWWSATGGRSCRRPAVHQPVFRAGDQEVDFTKAPSGGNRFMGDLSDCSLNVDGTPSTAAAPDPRGLIGRRRLADEADGPGYARMLTDASCSELRFGKAKSGGREVPLIERLTNAQFVTDLDKLAGAGELVSPLRQPRTCRCCCGQPVTGTRKFVSQDHYSVWLSRERFVGRHRKQP